MLTFVATVTAAIVFKSGYPTLFVGGMAFILEYWLLPVYVVPMYEYLKMERDIVRNHEDIKD